jgi:ribonuclease VapC
MSKAVLDASVLLAILGGEPGAAALTMAVLSESASSTVNLAEVQGKLVERGMLSEDAWEAALSPIAEAVSFTPEHARIAGDLVRQTRVHGLSLGDRACLALAIALKVPVYTADKSWKKLKIPVPIHVIR